MTVLTHAEGEVVDVIRRASMQGAPVATNIIRMNVWNSHRISYDQTQRALASLVQKGVLIKPSRGKYLLAERTK
jgi:hypothetical protein